MTDKSIIEAKLAKAKARLEAATTKVASLVGFQQKGEANLARLNTLLQDNPKLPQEVHVERGSQKSALSGLSYELAEHRKQVGSAQREVTRLQILVRSDEELAAAQQRWSEASAAEVQAVREADAAREELARLDALLSAEVLKTEAAQKAQSSAILVRLGFSKAPAPKVEEAESVLLGAAATVDALRTARPDIEAQVTAAQAKVASLGQVTRKAEQGILDVKQAVAEGNALLLVEAARVAVQTYHFTSIAARNHFGDRMDLYTQEDLAGWQQQQADRLRTLAAMGK